METRAAVEKHTGSVRSSRTVSEGLNSAVAAILHTPSGRVFVKGLHRDYPRRWAQDMEAMINPHVVGLSPRLLWRVEGEWDVLGFEVVEGRHADYQPGSPDVALLAGTMTELGEIVCPDLPVKVAEDRWGGYVDGPGESECFKGDRLLHTDYNPLNVFMADGRALLIDWAWPTRGAGWIDPACLIVRLMAAGHTAEEAESVVADVPAWRRAPQEAIDIFARANTRVWDEIAGNASASWVERMSCAAHAWLKHRS
ncbi:hypothetical protein ACGFIV_32640 [Sphaerisporangium sp. NPDC049003]|uniref:hypothetical protein n=1 Tax=Sphaerisporangium sp. NPDC049003 TaxID=3364517 RepID=UPI00371C900D